MPPRASLIRSLVAGSCVLLLSTGCAQPDGEGVDVGAGSTATQPPDARDLALRPDALRTDDSAFVGLDGWDYSPRYADVDGYRLAFVDEGPDDADPVLMLHGVPTWGYLYRHMIPVVVGAGHRVIVPDLIGFGRSDKPTSADVHTYAFHVNAISEFVREEDLTGITLVCQDWGSLIGLRVLAENPDRFDRVVLANGGLPVGGSTDLSQGTAALGAWQEAVKRMNTRGDMPIELILGSQVGAEATAAYIAPYPDPSHEVGPLTLPLRIPQSAEDPANDAQLAAWQVLSTWEKPFLTVFGDGDPITSGAERDFIERVPGASGQPHMVLAGASHFLQETHGVELARIVNEFIVTTRRQR